MRRTVLLLAGAVLISACRLQLAVDVTVEEDGAGWVEVIVALDADGVARIGGDLASVLEVDDLRDAGWAIEGPVLEGDDFTRLYLRRPFDRPEEAAVIFDGLAGPEGPLLDLRVDRSTSFARSEWTFAGRLDFSGGIEAFGDEALAAELDGLPLGQTREEIEAQLGEPLSEVIQVRVGVRLPGEVSANAPTVGEGVAVWAAAFGEPAQDLEATGEEQRTSTLVAAGAGALCALLLVLYAIVRLAGRLRTRRRGREPTTVEEPA